jgi:phenylpyruvate tautomerase PptA (4-oxalocrotonate tautomerase family)
MSQRKKKPAYNPRKLARERLQKLMGSILYVQDMFTIESGKIAGKIDADLAAIDGTTDMDNYKREQLERTKKAFLGLISKVSTNIGNIIVEADNTTGVLFEELKTKPWKETKDAAFVAELALEHSSTLAAIEGQNYTGMIIEIMQDHFRNVEFVAREVKAGASIEQAKERLADNIAKEAAAAKAAEVDSNATAVTTQEQVDGKLVVEDKEKVDVE